VISVSAVTMQLPTTIRSPIRSSLAEYARMRLTPERASSVNFMALKIPARARTRHRGRGLYLPEEGSADALALPGLERIARFGTKSVLAAGWRPWLARRVGCESLAEATARLRCRTVLQCRRRGRRVACGPRALRRRALEPALGPSRPPQTSHGDAYGARSGFP